MALKWIESRGGPFLILPKASLTKWEGIKIPSQGRIVSANFRFDNPDVPATDYDKACDVEDEIEKIDVQSVNGIVVGGEALPAAWFNEMNGFQNLLIRLLYSDGSMQIESLAQFILGNNFETNFEININEEDWIIFDSAEPGDEIIGEYLEIKLIPGKYKIETAYISPNQYNSFIIHRFNRFS